MSALTAAPPPVRPRMRGWIHLWSAVVSVAACATLIAVSAALVGGSTAAATSVYSATVLGLFGVSALYHRRRWRTARGQAVMQRVDHSMIFLFIAGTYTPVAVFALPPGTAGWVLVVVWAAALGGVVLQTVCPSVPAWCGVPVYLALGWVAVFVLPDVLVAAGVAPFVLLLAGGLLYTVGAGFYATHWPDPWPSTFGFHEFFHSATVLAALCHHVAIWLVLFAR